MLLAYDRTSHFSIMSEWAMRKPCDHGTLQFREPRVNMRWHNVQVDESIIRAFDVDPTPALGKLLLNKALTRGKCGPLLTWTITLPLTVPRKLQFLITSFQITNYLLPDWKPGWFFSRYLMIYTFLRRVSLLLITHNKWIVPDIFCIVIPTISRSRKRRRRMQFPLRRWYRRRTLFKKHSVDRWINNYLRGYLCTICTTGLRNTESHV